MQQINTPAAAAAWIGSKGRNTPRVIRRPQGFKLGPLTVRQANFVLDSAKGCSAAQLIDPQFEVPALNTLATASAGYHKAVAKYLAAEGAHRSFANSHDHDDPGHEQHQLRVRLSRDVMVAAEIALLIAERELDQARGECA